MRMSGSKTFPNSSIACQIKFFLETFCQLLEFVVKFQLQLVATMDEVSAGKLGWIHWEVHFVLNYRYFLSHFFANFPASDFCSLSLTSQVLWSLFHRLRCDLQLMDLDVWHSGIGQTKSSGHCKNRCIWVPSKRRCNFSYRLRERFHWRWSRCNFQNAISPDAQPFAIML